MHLINPFWNATPASSLTLIYEVLFEDASSSVFANTAPGGHGPATFGAIPDDGTATSSSAQSYSGAKSLRLAGPTDGHDGCVSAAPGNNDLTIGLADFKIEIAAYFVALTPSRYGNFLVDFDSMAGGVGVSYAPRIYIDCGTGNTTGGAFVFNNAHSGADRVFLSSGYVPTLNQWHLYGARRESGTLILSVDDVDLASIADPTNYVMGGPGYTVSLGRAGSTAGNVINGYLDDARFWSANV